VRVGELESGGNGSGEAKERRNVEEQKRDRDLRRDRERRVGQGWGRWGKQRRCLRGQKGGRRMGREMSGGSGGRVEDKRSDEMAWP